MDEVVKMKDRIARHARILTTKGDRIMTRDRTEVTLRRVGHLRLPALAVVIVVGLAAPGQAQPTLKKMMDQNATGQAGSAAGTGAPARDTASVPQDEYNRGTPRSAVEGFLLKTRAGAYDQAVEYLDLRSLSEAEMEEAANQARALKVVLDRTLWIDLDELSTDPEGRKKDGLPAHRDRVGQIEMPDGSTVDILLQRVRREDGVLVWKFSAATLSRLDELYAHFGYGPLSDYLPMFFFDIEFGGFRLWQSLVLLASLPLTVALAYVLTWPVLFVLRAWHTPRATMLQPFARGPLRLFLMAAILASLAEPLRLGVYAQAILGALNTALFIAGGAWVALAIVDALGGMLMEQLYRTGRTAAMPLLPSVRKVAKGLVVFLAVMQMLSSFGFNVTALVAGLGVGGIAVALAAQKTVENFIGGMTMYASQPVRVGDFCRFGDTVGTVEEIGLYATRVRTLHRTVVTVPNAEFSTLQLDNFSKRDRFWYHPTIGLRYETTPDQIRYILVEIRKVLYAHPRVHRDPARVRFETFSAYSLDLCIFAYVQATDYSEFLEVAEDLNLRIMDIVAQAGSSFAFPSQTAYLETGTGLDRERARAAEAAVHGWRERRELCLPAFPQERIDAMAATLDYPPRGSVMARDGAETERPAEPARHDPEGA
jgi:MscS family membrane protein